MISISKIVKRINPIFYWRRKGVLIGENCEIYPTANFGSEPYLIEIGNHVRINSGVNFITHDGGVWVLRELSILNNRESIDKFGTIKIGNNVSIGTNASILPGVTIGNNVVIGFGSIVTKDIPNNCVVAGIPGKIIESIEDYEQKNLKKFDYTKKMKRKDKKEYLIMKYKNK